LTLVDVEFSSKKMKGRENSLWDKIKGLFEWVIIVKKGETDTLGEHGVDPETAEHFNDSWKSVNLLY